jgi:membrane-associated phospholipid phosphatase
MLVLTLTSKKFFGRIRPSVPEASKRMMNLRSLENNCSFPSGDTAQGAVLAFFIYYHFPYFSGALGDFTFIGKFVMMVAIGRVFHHCHYFGDTLFGALLGFLVVSGFYHSGLDGMIKAPSYWDERVVRLIRANMYQSDQN